MAKKYIDVDAYKEKLKLRQEKLSNRQAYRDTPTREFTNPCIKAEYSVEIRSPHEILNTRIDGQLEGLDYAIEELDNMPTADVSDNVHGEWINREVIDDRKDAKIQQWQQAQCSICWKWHTTPYMYHFTDHDFCPNCGASMKH